MKKASKFQLRHFLGIVYLAGGATLFFYFAAEFVFRLALALIGFILMWRGLQLLGIDLRAAALHHYMRSRR